MADHSAAGFSVLRIEPGNPEFPTLPDGVDSLHIIEIGRTPGLEIPRQVIETLDKHSADDSQGYTDWFTDGIWRKPNPVDFGNITAAKVRQVTLHNTFRQAVSLTAIDVSAIGGLSVTSPVSLPQTIEAYDTITITFEVAAAGDNAFDDDVIFTVDGALLPVRMIGRRIIIFNTLPEMPITERISWLSDRMTSSNGEEQVFSVRQTPRSRVTYIQRLTDDEERTRQQTLIMGAGFLRQGAQLWWQARRITSAALLTDTIIQLNTLDMEIAIGTDLSFVAPDLTVVEGEVDSFTASTVTLTQAIGTALPVGTMAMPLQYGYMTAKANLVAWPMNAEDMSVSFDLVEYAEDRAINAAYFDSHPIDGAPIITHPLEFDGRARGGDIIQALQILDSKTGDLDVSRTELLGRPGMPVKVTTKTMADQHAWRQFLHYVRGSWGKFYIPTGLNDLPLSSVLSLGGNTFTVPTMGITSLLGNVGPRRDVKLDVDGTIYFRRITNISDDGTDETITLDSVIPGAGTVPIADVRVSWLLPVRIDKDVAVFKHTRLGEAELRFTVRGVIEA